MQVVGLDPGAHEGAEQRVERRRIVVEAAQQHALGEDGDARIDQPADGADRLRHEFGGVIDVDDHHDRFGARGACAQRPDEAGADATRVGDGHACMPADDAEMPDRAERTRDPLGPARRDDEGIAPRQDHFEDAGVGRHEGAGGFESAGFEQAPPLPADHLAAEAEAAIDRADLGQLEEHPVGIAVDDAGQHLVVMIADRVGALVRRDHGLAGVGHILARDRSSLAFRRDQPRDVRAQRQRETLGDRPQAFGLRVGHEARGDQLIDGGDGAVHAVPCHGAGSGVNSTSSTRSAPVASMTSRSKPSAIPLAGGICASAARKSSSIG